MEATAAPLADATKKGATTIRAAFDIGSSQHKMLVAEMHPSDTGLTIQKVLFSQQVQVRLNQGLISNGGIDLPQAILQKSREVLQLLKDRASFVGATEFAGVATAVFRRARNGAQYLATVADELKLNLKVVSQEEEGEIGFLTAVALAAEIGCTDTASVVSWDSGGGSFQICALDNDNVIRVFQGPIGDANMMALMADVQGREFVSGMSVNPATMAHATELARRARELVLPGQTNAPDWLAKRLARPDTIVLGFGFHTSVFRACYDATGKEAYTRQDIWEGLTSLSEKSDQNIESTLSTTSLQPQASPYPEVEMVVPKLVLVHAVMSSMDINRVLYRETNGSCHGVLLRETFWTNT